MKYGLFSLITAVLLSGCGSSAITTSPFQPEVRKQVPVEWVAYRELEEPGVDLTAPAAPQPTPATGQQTQPLTGAQPGD